MEFNYENLKLLASQSGVRVNDLLALAPKNDPFYVGTPATVQRGEWFADVYQRAGYSRNRAPHLRRVHYWIVSQESPVIMPDGKPYHNTQGSWEFLIEASKAARYLGLVALDGIVDNKNPQPTTNALYWEDNAPGYEVQVPDLSDPEIIIYGLNDANIQPYHLELWCEKSTMNDVLNPVVMRYNANLVTFEGEVSITSVCVNLMQRIISSGGKPTRILYISDFDPAGNSMPVAMSRKLEYVLRLAEGEYDVKVKPLALTAEQVQRYKLPRIPIKDTETRARGFEAAFGSGAVELDALEALYPGVLARLVNDAFKPYYNVYARRERDEMIQALRQAVSGQAAAVVSRYQPQIAALKQMQDELKAITVDASEFAVETYAPHVDEDDDWLFDASREYVEQIRHYKAHKLGVELDAAG